MESLMAAKESGKRCYNCSYYYCHNGMHVRAFCTLEDEAPIELDDDDPCEEWENNGDWEDQELTEEDDADFS
jgi:hypothetical protein